MLKPVTSVALVAFSVVVGLAAPAHAQTSVATRPGLEVIVPSGTVVPTGAQDQDVKRGNLTAVQLSYGLRPNLVLTSTLGWARTRPVGRGNDARLDLFTYDAGAEYRLARRPTDGRFSVKPFTGMGIGARTYNYRKVDLATTHHLAAYASAGGEIGNSRLRVRLEVRDYLIRLNQPTSSATSTRNDVAVLAGLRLGLR